MLEFRSGDFPADPDEHRVVNPGRHGRRLANHIAEGLRRAGWRVVEPDAEDWGWRVEVRGHGFPLWVGCGNVDGEEGDFLVFVEPDTPTVRRWFRTIDARPAAQALHDAVRAILSAAGEVRSAVPGDPHGGP